MRFDWQWKTINEERKTDEENERSGVVRRKDQIAADAPPFSKMVEQSPRQEKSDN